MPSHLPPEGYVVFSIRLYQEDSERIKAKDSTPTYLIRKSEAHTDRLKTEINRAFGDPPQPSSLIPFFSSLGLAEEHANHLLEAGHKEVLLLDLDMTILNKTPPYWRGLKPLRHLHNLELSQYWLDNEILAYVFVNWMPTSCIKENRRIISQPILLEEPKTPRKRQKDSKKTTPNSNQRTLDRYFTSPSANRKRFRDDLEASADETPTKKTPQQRRVVDAGRASPTPQSNRMSGTGRHTDPFDLTISSSQETLYSTGSTDEDDEKDNTGFSTPPSFMDRLRGAAQLDEKSLQIRFEETSLVTPSSSPSKQPDPFDDHKLATAHSHIPAGCVSPSPSTIDEMMAVAEAVESGRI